MYRIEQDINIFFLNYSYLQSHRQIIALALLQESEFAASWQQTW